MSGRTRITDPIVIRALERSPRLDAELHRLLHDAYVLPGFTAPERAATLFQPDAVHARGITFGAHDATGTLLGTVTLVRGGSPACRMAGTRDVEVHLLAVRADARGRGIGDALMSALLRQAEAERAVMAWLWTQPGMTSAQRLYERLRFRRVPDRDFRDGPREFLVFSRMLGDAAVSPAAAAPAPGSSGSS